MSVHILRDYSPAASGYGGPAGTSFTSWFYNIPVFLTKILGYSIVGQTHWDINNTNVQTFTATPTGTSVAVASNGQALPQSTINVNANPITAGYPASGTIYVGTTTSIAAASNGQSLPQATINVTSTANFPTSGTISIITSTGFSLVTYTGTGATTFTGCTGGTGTLSTNNYVASGTGVQIINYTGLTTSSFTGCTGGTGTLFTNEAIAYSVLKITTAVAGSPPTITTNFPHGLSSGQLAYISGVSGGNVISNGVWEVLVLNPIQAQLVGVGTGSGYTANSATLNPSGTLVAQGTGASINFAGAPSVYAVSVPAASRSVVTGLAPTAGDQNRMLVLKSSLYPTKNSGIFKISAVNTATNSYTIDYRSTDTPPAENGTLSWWLYELETQVSNYLYWPNYSRWSGTSVTAASNTTPIQISFTNNAQFDLYTGQKITITGVVGNTAANGTWFITVLSPGVFALNNSSGNGAYISGGTWSRPGYTGGDGYSPNSKIILQSPHAAAWQTRIAMEPFNSPGLQPHLTVAVGYGGSSVGDFPVGGTHTHIGQFLDINIGGTTYVNTLVGGGAPGTASRFTIVGDDGGQSVLVYSRSLAATANGLTMFGIPDNEPVPLQANINRPFAYGGCVSGDWGGIQLRFGSSNNVGFTFRDQVPEMCAMAGWANADGVSGTSPVYSANAGDCPFTGTTEVLPWEVWGGIATDPLLTLPYQTVYGINQRFMGTAPFIRQGRTNFGTFTLSTDNTATSTITGATNASPIQITTSAINALVTGQTVVISGVTGNTAANGTFVITVIDNTHFTLNGSTGNGTYGGGGTANGTPLWLHLQNGIYLAWNGAGGLTP